MSGEDEKRLNTNKSPKSGSTTGSTTMEGTELAPPSTMRKEDGPANENKPSDSPTKADLVDDILRLTRELNDLKVELRDNPQVKKLSEEMNDMKSEVRDSLLIVSKKVGDFMITQSATIQATNFQCDFLEEVNDRCIDNELRTTTIDKKVEKIDQKVKGNTAHIESVHQEVRQNTQEIKARNLVLNGIPEDKDEVVLDVAVKFLKNIDPAFNKNSIETAYRMGKGNDIKSKGRVLIVKFKSGEVKRELMRKKAALKNKKALGKVFYNDDLHEKTRKSLQEMREIAAFAKKNGYEDAKVTGQKLFVGGKTYTENELTLLPEKLCLKNIKTRPVGNGIGFQSKHSCLSNVFPCDININGKMFTSSEQAYQYYKAIVCERDDAAAEIKSINDAEKVKIKGDKLDTCPEWEERKVAYMKYIATQKFKQNLEIRAKLLGTGGMNLIECTKNRFWGSGRNFDSPEWANTHKYEGRNVMGKILEEVRESLDSPALNCTEMVQKVAPTMPDLARVPDPNGDLTSNITTQKQDNGETETEKNRKDESKTSRDLHESHKEVDLPCVAKSAKEISATIKPTTIPGAIASTRAPSRSRKSVHKKLPEKELEKDTPIETASNIDNKSTMNASNEELMDIEGIDSVSLSSVFSETSGIEPNDVKNLTLEDGRLDLQKISNWSLPPLNTSRLLGLTGRGSKESRDKLRRILKSQNEMGGNFDLSTSTPKTGPISKVESRKKTGRQSQRQGHVGGEKNEMTTLLKEMNLI